MNKRGVEFDTHAARACLAALLCVVLAALAFAGCGERPQGEPIVEIPPHGQETPAAGEPTEAPVLTEAATAEPTEYAAPTDEPPTLEAQILSGAVYPLFNGQTLDGSWEGVSLDVDGDGVQETICVSERDGGDTVLIDGEPFMDGGLKVSLVSFDGEHMLFCARKPGDEALRFFYPDEDGNLFCRLFGVSRGADAGALASLSSDEERIRAGLDIMLHNPLLYDSVTGDIRNILLDMDGDGTDERIVFDGMRLTINGFENRQILSATMPRFAYDSAHGCIVLTGSAGDYSLILRLENGQLKEDISYAQLL